MFAEKYTRITAHKIDKLGYRQMFEFLYHMFLSVLISASCVIVS
mgnify:CR=1 FL=1